MTRDCLGGSNEGHNTLPPRQEAAIANLTSEHFREEPTSALAEKGPRRTRGYRGGRNTQSVKKGKKGRRYKSHSYHKNL